MCELPLKNGKLSALSYRYPPKAKFYLTLLNITVKERKEIKLILFYFLENISSLISVCQTPTKFQMKHQVQGLWDIIPGSLQ